jgi:DNA modification methylase
MAGEKASLCFTSPPYLQQRDYTAASDCSDWDGLMRGVFANLPMADDGQVLVNLGLVHSEREWIPYWNKWIEWMTAKDWLRYGWYVWDKGCAARKDGSRFPTEHEFVFHFTRHPVDPLKSVRCKSAGTIRMMPVNFSGPDGQHRSAPCRKVVNEFRVPGSVCHIRRSADGGVDHPAAFPVAFALYWIECWPGFVFDPFLGSGTTMIAAEQLGRRCYGMEIEPRYVDVAMRRWEEFTGKKAKLIRGAKKGKTAK